MRMELEEKNPDPKYGKKPLYVTVFTSIFDFSLNGRRNGNNDCKGWMGVDLMDLMQSWILILHNPVIFSHEFPSFISENGIDLVFNFSFDNT